MNVNIVQIVKKKDYMQRTKMRMKIGMLKMS